LLPVEAETDRLAALLKHMGKDPTEVDFERRAKLAELLLKERELETKEDIVTMQMRK